MARTDRKMDCMICKQAVILKDDVHELNACKKKPHQNAGFDIVIGQEAYALKLDNCERHFKVYNLGYVFQVLFLMKSLKI